MHKKKYVDKRLKKSKVLETKTNSKDEYYVNKLRQISSKYKGDPEMIRYRNKLLLLEILEKELGFTETIKEFMLLEK